MRRGGRDEDTRAGWGKRPAHSLAQGGVGRFSSRKPPRSVPRFMNSPWFIVPLCLVFPLVGAMVMLWMRRPSNRMTRGVGLVLLLSYAALRLAVAGVFLRADGILPELDHQTGGAVRAALVGAATKAGLGPKQLPEALPGRATDPCLCSYLSKEPVRAFVTDRDFDEVMQAYVEGRGTVPSRAPAVLRSAYRARAIVELPRSEVPPRCRKLHDLLVEGACIQEECFEAFARDDSNAVMILLRKLREVKGEARELSRALPRDCPEA